MPRKLPFDLTQSTIVKGAELAHLAERPLPKAPDGEYDYASLATGEKLRRTTVREHSGFFTVTSDIQGALERGNVVSDPRAPEAVFQAITNPEAIDDRKGLSPPGKLQDTLNDKVITVLYETLTHPPATFMDDEYRFRKADGSGNNVTIPDLGQSGRPYARSVQGKHPLPANVLPDAGLVFDTLLKARDFQPHPGRNSSLTFAFASIVTHSLFRTDPADRNKNNTSSYLDLSPVYGTNQIEQDLVRDKAQGRGLLYPDTFSEDRLQFLPPAASALLVIFSRNHNYIADMLLKINEKKKWRDPATLSEAERAKQDEEIFQTARLVNCGHFMALIFGDYVAGFLGLGRDGCTWSMNPFDTIHKEDGDLVQRGTGNHVSVEFNVLYRWHATTAQEDIKWAEDQLGNVFRGKALDKLELSDFQEAARELFTSTHEPEPRKRTFSGLKRQQDGSFSDDDIAKLLHDGTEKVAGAYRARGTPACLRVIEMVCIEQARKWGVCTMNEFREFLGLKRFSSFEEWSTAPGIADAARRLYGHIDNLELHPGLQAEDCMALGPGSGICCGYTMTRAILADAIALVRGDRFFTTDYTPEALTSWGFQDCVRDPNNGAFGAALPRLLFRHLPRHYPANSVYALFPFFTPEITKTNLTKLGIADKYDYSRPVAQPIPKVLNTLTGIRHVFADPTKYIQIYTRDMTMLTRGYGFMLVFDEREKHDRDRAFCWHALVPDAQTMQEYTQWYKQMTIKLLNEKKFTYDGVPGTYVDIIRDVINLVSVHWAADKLCGISLKTKATPRGIFTEQEVYTMFTVLFMCVFENVAPEHGWTLRAAATQIGTIVNGIIQQSINEAAPKIAINPFIGQKKECAPFLSRLAASGRPIDELVGCVIGLAVGSSVNFAQAAAQVVDFYLREDRQKECAALITACMAPDSDKNAMELVRGYVREGMRLNPQFGGLFRIATADDVVPQGQGFQPMQVKKGDMLFASFKNAHLNPDDFPDPETVNPRRPKSSYNIQGAGFHGCPGVDFVADTIPEIIRIIFRLPDLRRAPGPAGVCAGFALHQFDTDNDMYITSTGNVSPWPGSLQVVVS
ncbi:heme peroxidase [Laetiporus sulphureus 93-53]|uniref:Heme peroxidase n=1 Tax=Laetiporus sulphureus 93-53 TaxID=1314785 RepID=A0A165BG40_9APHY|nr:heme peroxidase [Laetiporus sulphureus 93-53]KZT00985.1 heme peroxidase [Laetiporus sulphureus 93-53]